MFIFLYMFIIWFYPIYIITLFFRVVIPIIPQLRSLTVHVYHGYMRSCLHFNRPYVDPPYECSACCVCVCVFELLVSHFQLRFYVPQWLREKCIYLYTYTNRRPICWLCNTSRDGIWAPSFIIYVAQISKCLTTHWANDLYATSVIHERNLCATMLQFLYFRFKRLCEFIARIHRTESTRWIRGAILQPQHFDNNVCIYVYKETLILKRLESTCWSVVIKISLWLLFSLAFLLSVRSKEDSIIIIVIVAPHVVMGYVLLSE